MKNMDDTNIYKAIKNNFENNKPDWAKKIIEGGISLSLVFMFLALPNFASKYYQLQGIEFGKQISFYLFILVALVFWLINCALSGEIKIRRTPLDIPILIFWFSCFLSTIFSVDRWHSFWGFFGDPTHGLLNLTAIIVAFYFILSTFNMKRFRIILVTIFLSGGIVLFWETLIVTGLINLQSQKFLQIREYLQYIPNSRVGSISGTAIFLNILVVLLVAVFLRLKCDDFSKTKKLIYGSVILLLIVICLYLLLAFYFFVPWIGFSVGMGFFIFYIFVKNYSIGRGSRWLLGVIFAYIVLAIILGNVFLSNHKVTSVSFPMEVNLSRDISWEIVKESLVKNNFFIGSGPATYGYVFSLYRPQDFNLNNFYNLRFYKGAGFFWEALPTIGVLGTFSAIFLIISFLSVVIFLLNKGRKKNQIYSLGCASATIIILVDAFFMRLDGSMIILGALLATLTLGIILWESDTEEKYFKFSLRAHSGHAPVVAVAFVATIVCIFFLFNFLLRFFMADMLVNIANKDISPEYSIENMGKAIALNSKEGRYYTIFGQKYIKMANIESLKKEEGSNNLVGEYLEKSIIYTLKGKQLMPKDVVVVEAFAQAVENKSLYSPELSDQAIEAYNEALWLEPHNAVYFLKIGEIITRKIAIEKDDFAKKELASRAKDWFQKAIIKKEDLIEAQFQLALMQQILGEKNEAILSLQKAIELDNAKLDYFLMLANIYVSRGAEGDYETAEDIYKKIISVQGNEVGIYLSLGNLYEKMKRFSDAVVQYKKIFFLLPENNIEARDKLQKMIENAEQGIENVN